MGTFECADFGYGGVNGDGFLGGRDHGGRTVDAVDLAGSCGECFGDLDIEDAICEYLACRNGACVVQIEEINVWEQ
jgi:hypothetical protein